MEDIMRIKTIMLCGGKKCCPKLSIEKGLVCIVDDDGNKVTMKKSQAKLISSALKQLEKK